MSKQINLSLSDDLYALVEDAMLDGERISRTARRLLSERLTEVSDTSDPWAGLDKRTADAWEVLAMTQRVPDKITPENCASVTLEQRVWLRKKLTSEVADRRAVVAGNPESPRHNPLHDHMVALGVDGAVEPVLKEPETRAEVEQHLRWMHYINEWANLPLTPPTID